VPEQQCAFVVILAGQEAEVKVIACWSLRSARHTAAAGFFAGLLLVSPATAQTSIDASVSGTITDPSGAVVPAADLELKNTETNAVFRAASDGAGFYHFPRIPRGAYALTVQKDGFRTLVRDGLIIGVNQAPVVNLQLMVGEVGSAITVKADAALLQTQTASFSMLVDEARIRDRSTERISRNCTSSPPAWAVKGATTLPSITPRPAPATPRTTT
jgi:Carboxypeptidase regulatory-like domain